MNGRVPIPTDFDNPAHFTERPEGERKPLESDGPFREIFESAPFGVGVTGLDTRFLHVNGPLCRMLGYPAEELVGTSWTQLTHPDDVRLSLEKREQLINEPGGCLELQKRYIRRGGAVLWARMRISLARDSSGNPLYFVVHMKDITKRKRANEALHESEDRFRTIADSCPAMMWATDTKGHIQFFNRSCREFCGIGFVRVDRGEWGLLLHPDDQQGFVSAFDLAIAEHASFSIEARARRADGEWRLLGWRAEPSFSSGGEFLGHIGLCADITERIQAEQKRQFELSLIRSILEGSPDGILVVDQAGIVVSYNQRFLGLWGLDQSTSEGPRPHSFVGSEDRALLSSVLDRLENPDSFVNRVQELYRHPDQVNHDEIILKDGRTLERHSTGLRDSEGKYLGRVWFFRDITAHKQAAVSLRNANALADKANRRLCAERSILEVERNTLRALIDNMPDLIFVKDVEGRFVLANSYLARVVGAEAPGKMLGKTDLDFFPPQLAGAFREGDLEVIRTGQPLHNCEEQGLDEAGNETRILTTKVPIRDPRGRIVGVAGISRDITARKKLDQERRMLRTLIDNIPDFIYVKDAKGRFALANLHVARLMGAPTPEELLGKTDFDYYPREMANGFYEDEQNIMRSGQPLFNREQTNLDSAGKEVHVLSTKVPVRDSTGQIIGIAGIGRDNSARKRAEDALREAERKYRGLFDNAVAGIFQSTPDGRILSVNPALARMYGFDSPEEFMAGLGNIASQAYVDPKRREDMKLLMERDGGARNFEFEALRKDGGAFWMSMSAVAIRENGVVVRYEGMTQDITERKLLQGQLLQAQKLESVGQLAAGIAHEINTPTQYIGDNVRFLKDAFQDLKSLLSDYEHALLAANNGMLSKEANRELAAAVKRADPGYLMEEIPKAIDQTLEGVTRVAKIVGAMKEFSHPGSKEKSPLDLNHAIENAITVARNEWKYVADMETEFDPSLPPVLCLPGEFNQVILNLIVNAAHAIGDVVKQGGPGKGKIKVQTSNCIAWAEIRIQDTGSGIPKEVQSRIFDPFFTTKEVGKGTGQGLAIARSVIVDKHGGSIRFETEQGKGTTFIVRLPYDGKPLATKAVAA
jgi:PAS domain S-box-containing protein